MRLISFAEWTTAVATIAAVASPLPSREDELGSDSAAAAVTRGAGEEITAPAEADAAPASGLRVLVNIFGYLIILPAALMLAVRFLLD